ncbi:MAG: DNA adenine methylase [Promethearchaeota archaeon]
MAGDTKPVDRLAWLERTRERNLATGRLVGVPQPFLKWAGGKRQLIPQLSRLLPDEFEGYVEPFVGGGALFFFLLPDRAVLIDNNPELVNVFKVVRDDVEALIAELKKHPHDKEHYYEVRSWDRRPDFAERSPVERAARTVYLNRTCYNGLYRVNSKGQFNVPFGRYANPTICDEENLRAASAALEGAKLVLGSFEECLRFVEAGDLVYLDPPYQPLSATSNFTGYTRDGFGEDEQRRLREVFGELDRRGAHVALSNSAHPFVLDLYEGYEVNEVVAKRAINCKASRRGGVGEVVVTNYSNGTS